MIVGYKNNPTQRHLLQNKAGISVIMRANVLGVILVCLPCCNKIIISNRIPQTFADYEQ